jgi:hypothetical protein
MKAILAAAAVLACTCSTASAQINPFNTDHFKCYLPANADQVQPAPVQLLDQFGPSAAVVGNIFRFCNPTRKLHEGAVTPIQAPDDHLTLHQISPQPDVTRLVVIRNQFGERQIITHDERVLAVPTQKRPHGPVQGLGHFSCYAAEGQLVDEPVGLEDQFFASKHRVGRPVLFCNPVQKWHDGVFTPIANPADHLTCYSMTPQPYARVTDIRNQFGDLRLETSFADMLCVPTQKLAWNVID